MEGRGGFRGQGGWREASHHTESSLYLWRRADVKKRGMRPPTPLGTPNCPQDPHPSGWERVQPLSPSTGTDGDGDKDRGHSP